MPKGKNRVRNPDLSRGRTAPSAGRWFATARGVRWRRSVERGRRRPGGMHIICDDSQGSGCWSQYIECSPGKFYRVEATVTCNLSAGDGEEGGLVVVIEPVAGSGRRNGQRIATPPVISASTALAVRTYYQAPERVRRVKLSVGVERAIGSASVRHVRFIPIMQPENESHVLAVPPPTRSLRPPKVARSIAVCAGSGRARPITELLAGFFGARNVRTLAPADLSLSAESADTLLLPDGSPPAALRSLRELLAFAQDRIVLISLPAFAGLSRGRISVKCVEQSDDPIHARVVYGCHATQGFALHDAFPYAWPGKAQGSFVQNHFRRTREFNTLCERHGLLPLLASLCNTDLNSDRAAALYKPTGSGALYVLDIEPVEAAVTSFAEATLAMHLLLGVLGQTVTGLGQYVVPERREADFRTLIREMPERFEHLIIRERDVPVEELPDQLLIFDSAAGAGGVHYGVRPPGGYYQVQSEYGRLGPGTPDRAAAQPSIQGMTGEAAGTSVRVGGGKRPLLTASDSAPTSPDQSVAALLTRPGGAIAAERSQSLRPIILIRTGLTAGDLESVYGALIWLKQLVRMAPFTCPYARELGERFRIAWIPLAAEWESNAGWRRSGLPPARTYRWDLGEECVASLIDIVSRPVNRVRVVFQGDGTAAGHCRWWLPRLFDMLPPGRYFQPDAGQGGSFRDFDRLAWRHVESRLFVDVDGAAFRDSAHQAVLSTGGNLVRLEVPGSDADFSARSIQRTDLVATLLEQVIGLHLGILAVNRGASPVQLDALPVIEPGETLLLPHDHSALRASLTG